MKKMFFMAFVAGSMIFASCGKSMSPEAQKAWNVVKEKAAGVCTIEAVDEFESVEDYKAAVQDFQAAVQEMTKYQDQYSKEIADSLTTMTNKFNETCEKAAALIQAQVEEAIEEAAEEVEEEVEE